MTARAGWPHLGDKVREIVTGQEGVVTGFCEYLWGCEQVLVARTDKDEKLDNQWYDIGRVEIVERKSLSPVSYATPTTAAPKGADIPAPIR